MPTIPSFLSGFVSDLIIGGFPCEDHSLKTKMRFFAPKNRQPSSSKIHFAGTGNLGFSSITAELFKRYFVSMSAKSVWAWHGSIIYPVTQAPNVMPDAHPRETCPYCGTEGCCADWVNVEIGYVQCGPYICENCGATSIGAFDQNHKTEEEIATGWFRPGNIGTSVNTSGGRIVASYRDAEDLYRAGMLDEKIVPDDALVKPDHATWDQRTEHHGDTIA